MEIRSAANLGTRVQVHFKGVGRTKQSLRKETDINFIMAKYEKTGLVDHLSKHGGDYGFASSVDFHECMNVVTKAEQMFEDLPAEVRRRFNEEPGAFLDFVVDPENREELIDLGLASEALKLSVEADRVKAVAEVARITSEEAVKPIWSPPEEGSDTVGT